MNAELKKLLIKELLSELGEEKPTPTPEEPKQEPAPKVEVEPEPEPQPEPTPVNTEAEELAKKLEEKTNKEITSKLTQSLVTAGIDDDFTGVLVKFINIASLKDDQGEVDSAKLEELTTAFADMALRKPPRKNGKVTEVDYDSGSLAKYL